MNDKPARHWSRYVKLASFAVIIIGVPLLFIPLDNYYQPRSLGQAWNFGHVVLFACATIMLSSRWRWLRARSFELQVAILALLSLLVGYGIELVQLHTGGDYSLQDVCLDISGACLAAAVYPGGRRPWMKYSPLFLRLAVIAYLLFRAYPLALDLVDEYRARAQFPVLADFTSSLQLDRFGGGAGLKITAGGMQVSFGTTKYSGFSLKYFPRDWRGYAHVRIELNNPGPDEIDLTCRIHDELHNQSYDDRFNRRFAIQPGAQAIMISLAEVENSPRTRKMDLGRIGGLGCFTVSRAIPAQLVISSIALSRH